MRVRDLLDGRKPVFSFEFFLPKTPDGHAAFRRTVKDLKDLQPSFVTLTYGAGGSVRARTIEMAGTIQNELGLETVAHLTCIAHSRQEIRSILGDIRAYRIENIMALRGDVPKDGAPLPGEYRYAAELVADVRAFGGFCVGVAGYPETHPEAAGPEQDLANLKSKIAAGGDYVTTQLFFDNDLYFAFVGRARALGIRAPILPGLMPVTNVAQLTRFSTMCGATIPEKMKAELAALGDDADAVIHYGIEWTFRQAKDLLERGAPGIHFYTLNKSLSTQMVLSRLRESF